MNLSVFVCVDGALPDRLVQSKAYVTSNGGTCANSCVAFGTAV